MRNFIFGQYLPLLDEKIGHIELSLLEKAELFENTIGTVIKLLYGFVWQEEVIDFGGEDYLKCNHSCFPWCIKIGLNMTPEANAAGAAFTPKLNAFGNNLTRWDLTVEDVQVKVFKIENMYVSIYLMPTHSYLSIYRWEADILAVLGAMMSYLMPSGMHRVQHPFQT